MSFAGDVINKQLAFKTFRPDDIMYRIRVREDAQDLIPDAFQHLEVENGRRGTKETEK